MCLTGCCAEVFIEGVFYSASKCAHGATNEAGRKCKESDDERQSAVNGDLIADTDKIPMSRFCATVLHREGAESGKKKTDGVLWYSGKEYVIPRASRPFVSGFRVGGAPARMQLRLGQVVEWLGAFRCEFFH